MIHASGINSLILSMSPKFPPRSCPSTLHFIHFHFSILHTSAMPSIFHSPARTSLPSALSSLLHLEFATHSRLPRPSNRLSPSLRNARTITTIPIDSVPITSSTPPPSQTSAQNESSITADITDGTFQYLTAEPSVQSPTNSKRPSPPRQSQTKLKSYSDNSNLTPKSDTNTKKFVKKNGKDKADEKKKKKRDAWEIQKETLKKKFPDGWSPTKKLSPDAIEGLRHLHSMAPDQFTTSVLAAEFKISPEAIRRILKSKWRASETELESRRKRWEKREERIWSHMSELGLRPHRKRTESLSDATKLLYKKSNRSRMAPKPPSDLPHE
ncbi:hypothetical protein BJX70DRAFT_360294 [Aspergillus crustosus]